MRAEELLAMQRQVLAALRAPLLGDSRARTDLPARAGALPPTFAATAASWLTPSATLTPVDRLELYHRQYWYRLLDSLAEDFPGLRLVLGKRRFWAVLERYLEARPPHTFSLRNLGADLADHLAARPEELAHAAHAVELARLEYAWILAFEAAELAAAPAEQLATGALGLQPHLTLLALRTSADTLWRRAEAGRPRGRLAPAAAQPDRFLAIYRDGLHRHVERLHPAAYALLSSIASAQGASEQGASEQGASERGASEQGASDQGAEGAAGTSLERALAAAEPQLPARGGAARIQAWFAQWTQRRWFVLRAPPAPLP